MLCASHPLWDAADRFRVRRVPIFLADALYHLDLSLVLGDGRKSEEVLEILALLRTVDSSNNPADQSMIYSGSGLSRGLVTVSGDCMLYDPWSCMPISGGGIRQRRLAYGTYVPTSRLPAGFRLSAPTLGRRVGPVEPRHPVPASSLPSGLPTEAVQDALRRSGASAEFMEDTLRSLRDVSGVLIFSRLFRPKVMIIIRLNC